MEPTNVFEANPKSIEKVLADAGKGFYIPSYQRPYSWEKNNVGALLTTICEGIQALEQMEDAISFIGTFIFVHDITYATVEPQVRQDLPSAVYLIIDGQQRLSTLSMLSVAIHYYIKKISSKIGNYKSDDINSWIAQNKSEILARLENTFSLDKQWGEENLRWYPRIIRAHKDSWSTNKSKYKYNSPIGMFLHKYIEHSKSDPQGNIEFEFKEDSSNLGQEAIATNYKHITSEIKALIESKNSTADDGLPDLLQIIQPNHIALQRRFFWNDVPGAVQDTWKEEYQKNRKGKLSQLSRLFMIARYLLDRVAVTQVLVKKEEYAFDIFEAINTTGEPLTAYETFKPIIIKTEGIEKFDSSEAAKHLKQVDILMEEAVEKRRQNSDRFLISFALYHEGFKLNKKLREQRNWLRKNYEGTDKPGKAIFLQGMSDVSSFLLDIWPDNDNYNNLKLKLTAEEANLAQLCLRVLRGARHEITSSLLARFYSEFLHAPNPDKESKSKEFLSALKAVTAFFAIWRGSRVGTENIDAVYRNLMSKAEDIGGVQLGPFNRKDQIPISSTALKKILLNYLVEKSIDNKNDWVSKSFLLNIYKQSRELTRILLLASSHDAIPDQQNPGFTKLGKVGCCPMLLPERWDSFNEIEHIAPQKPQDPSHWDEDIYKQDLVDTLGNLTLIPGKENASLGNRAWKEKTFYFQVLSLDDPTEISRIITKAASVGFNIPTPTQTLLSESVYMPHIRSIGLLNEWSADFVKKRSQHIAEMAWNRLYDWIDPTK